MCGCMQDRFGRIHKHICKLLITFPHCMIFYKTIYSGTAFVDVNSALVFQIQWIHLSFSPDCTFYLTWWSVILSFLKNDSISFLRPHYPSFFPASPAPSVFIDGTSSTSPVKCGKPSSHRFPGILALHLLLLHTLLSAIRCLGKHP